MDRRRTVERHSAYAVATNDPDTYESDGEYDNKKGKYSIPMSTWAGIWMSAALLLTFVVVLATRMDIIHIALSHESTFHANHIPENHLDKVLSRPVAAVPQPQSMPPLRDLPSTSTVRPFVAPPLPPKPMATSEPKNLRGNELSANQPSSSSPLGDLEDTVKHQIELVRKLKFEDHVVMEQDETAKREITKLQNLLREYIPQKYGPEPYRVEMVLQFPESMHDEGRADEEKIIFELGPLKYVPYSTYKFLEIMETFKGGAFHRRAGHVLQAMVTTRAKHLAFQEYHPQFPHVKHTLGYAGRPGGPEFYISTVDNSENHGPASQGSKTEADSCFGKIVDGADVVKRMQRQPGGAKGSGFISDSKNFIRITSFRVVR